jgi:hypothetical protein
MALLHGICKLVGNVIGAAVCSNVVKLLYKSKLLGKHMKIFMLKILPLLISLYFKKILVHNREGEPRDNTLMLASVFFRSFNISLRELCNSVPV